MNKIRIPIDEGTKYEKIKYPGGEFQLRFSTDKQILDVMRSDYMKVIVGHNTDPMELALLTNAINKLNPSMEKWLVFPYLPYARADRRFALGDCFGLEVFAQFINNLGYSYVYAMDTHSTVAEELIRNFKNIEVTHRIEDVLKRLPSDTALLFPDYGASQRYRALLGRDNAAAVFECSKDRDPITGKLSKFTIPTHSIGGSGRKISNYNKFLIVDDICDGGGTFAGIADLMPKDSQLYLYVTHGIFSKGLEPLHRFTHIYTTDSINQVETLKLTVLKSGILE